MKREENNTKSLWVVSETGLTGTLNQGLGIADALKITPDIKEIGLRQPWRSLSPWLGFECGFSFTGASLTPPWPDILITAGRKAVAASLYIKRASRGKTFTVHLQNPNIAPHHFDLVILPHHDWLRGANVFVTDATPNRISAERIGTARKAFEKQFSPLPAPRIAVMIGGKSKAYKFDEQDISALTAQLEALNGSLMISTSRRTPPHALRAIEALAKDKSAYLYKGGDAGKNPYLGMLAWADYIIVTPDSASMLSDAATIGKPLYMPAMRGGTVRLMRLHAHLRKHGALRTLGAEPPKPLESFDYEPLKDAEKAALAIKERLALRGEGL